MAKFQPGTSGNPAGRKPRVVEDAERSLVGRVFDDAAEMRAIAAMAALACEGDVAAFKALMERKHGKVKDVVEKDIETIIRVEYAD